MPISNTKQSSLTILTLQDTAGETLSQQINNVGRFIYWGGKKLLGLVCPSNNHAKSTFAKAKNTTHNLEESTSRNVQNLSPSSEQSTPSTSLSKEAMASRVIASATIGLLLGGLPGAVACSGATFIDIQIERALASHENKALPILALITLNLAAVIIPDKEIHIAYSEGRYADVLTAIITKAPSNLLLGTIFKMFIQFNIENIANHCLPKPVKPKNNELISAVFSGTSDALSLYSAPIARQQIENFMQEFVHFPTAMGQIIPTDHPTVYSAPIGSHALLANTTAINLSTNDSSWIYTPAWRAINNKIGAFNFNTAYKNYSIAFPNPSSRMQGALTFGVDCPLSQVPQYSLYLNSHTFNFSTLDGGPWLTKDAQTGAMLYQIKFLLLSEMPFSNFKIAFLSTNKDCFSTFESCTQYNLSSPYVLKISSTEIQYHITKPLPISTTSFSTSTSPTSSPSTTSNDSDKVVKYTIFGALTFVGSFIVIIIGGRAIVLEVLEHKQEKNAPLSNQPPNERTLLINA